MAWKKTKTAIEENPITTEEVKKMSAPLPELPSYQETVKMAAVKKPIAEEYPDKWQLVEVPTQTQIVFKDNETDKLYSLHEAICRLLNIVDGAQEE